MSREVPKTGEWKNWQVGKRFETNRRYTGSIPEYVSNISEQEIPEGVWEITKVATAPLSEEYLSGGVGKEADQLLITAKHVESGQEFTFHTESMFSEWYVRPMPPDAEY